MADLPVLKDVAKLDNCVTVIDACNFESTFYTGKVRKLILIGLFQTVKAEFIIGKKKRCDWKNVLEFQMTRNLSVPNSTYSWVREKIF